MYLRHEQSPARQWRGGPDRVLRGNQFCSLRPQRGPGLSVKSWQRGQATSDGTSASHVDFILITVQWDVVVGGLSVGVSDPCSAL